MHYKFVPEAKIKNLLFYTYILERLHNRIRKKSFDLGVEWGFSSYDISPIHIVFMSYGGEMAKKNTHSGFISLPQIKKHESLLADVEEVKQIMNIS